VLLRVAFPILLLLAAASPAGAQRVELTEACVDDAARQYGHDGQMFRALLDVEGGRVGETGPRNANGTYDLGPAQINDRVWVPHLARRLDRSEEDTRRLLIDDGCANVMAASYILALAVDRGDGDLVRGFGYYHSATPEHHQAYVDRWLDAYERRVGTLPPALAAYRDPAFATEGDRRRLDMLAARSLLRDAVPLARARLVAESGAQAGQWIVRGLAVLALVVVFMLMMAVRRNQALVGALAVVFLGVLAVALGPGLVDWLYPRSGG
jgi:hypothetical protein